MCSPFAPTFSLRPIDIVGSHHHIHVKVDLQKSILINCNSMKLENLWNETKSVTFNIFLHLCLIQVWYWYCSFFLLKISIYLWVWVRIFLPFLGCIVQIVVEIKLLLKIIKVLFTFNSWKFMLTMISR